MNISQDKHPLTPSDIRFDNLHCQQAPSKQQPIPSLELVFQVPQELLSGRSRMRRFAEFSRYRDANNATHRQHHVRRDEYGEDAPGKRSLEIGDGDKDEAEHTREAADPGLKAGGLAQARSSSSFCGRKDRGYRGHKPVKAPEPNAECIEIAPSAIQYGEGGSRRTCECWQWLLRAGRE